jgi:hypothetical protein
MSGKPGDRADILCELERRRQEAIRATFTRLDPVAFGAGLGATAAVALFTATAALLLKGSPRDDVGAHLGVLGNLLPGYAVTWGGAAVGAVYGLLAGFVAGAFAAGVRNAALRFVLWRVDADQRRFRNRHLLDEI